MLPGATRSQLEQAVHSLYTGQPDEETISFLEQYGIKILASGNENLPLKVKIEMSVDEFLPCDVDGDSDTHGDGISDVVEEKAHIDQETTVVKRKRKLNAPKKSGQTRAENSNRKKRKADITESYSKGPVDYYKGESESNDCGCNIIFKSKTDRLLHLRLSHSLNPTFPCSICNNTKTVSH